MNWPRHTRSGTRFQLICILIQMNSILIELQTTLTTTTKLGASTGCNAFVCEKKLYILDLKKNIIERTFICGKRIKIVFFSKKSSKSSFLDELEHTLCVESTLQIRIFRCFFLFLLARIFFVGKVLLQTTKKQWPILQCLAFN